MNEIQTQKYVILMKSKLTLFVEKGTAMQISEHLVNQNAHSFIKISELGQTINSAEIEGIYSPEKYAELLRLKAGDYQCTFSAWHKRKEECDCAIELARKEKQKKQDEEMAEINRPLTPEEREIQREDFLKSDEMFALDKPDSVFRTRYRKGSRSGRAIRLSTIKEWEKKNGSKADVSDLLVNTKA